MKCLLCVCADSVIRDVETNLITLVNVVEQITLSSVPGVVAQLGCVFLVQKEPGDELSIPASVMLSLGGQELLRGPVSIRFNGTERYRQILQIGGLILPAPGILKLALLVGDNEMGTWEIPVVTGAHPQLNLPLQSEHDTP